MRAQDDAHTRKHGRHFALLSQYFLLTYLVTLANTWRFAADVQYTDVLTGAFAAAVWLLYAAAYLLPVHVPVLLLDGLLGFVRGPRALRVAARVVLFAVAVLGFSLVQVLLYADGYVHHLWGRHIGSFEWNLVTTPGGVESMGNTTSTITSFSLIVVGFVGLQAGLLVLLLKISRLRRFIGRLFARPVRVGMIVAVVVVLLFQSLTYGACMLRYHTPVLRAATNFPLYVPMTFSKLGRQLGWEAPREEFDISTRGKYLNYPLEPLRRIGNPARYNIVFLVAESWRADMLDLEIMPKTCAYARRGQWFRQHYSGGTGTRMGVFSLFYGLHGTYWEPMLQAQRSPVLMDLLQEDGYQIELFTSQMFQYPEFDRTVFSHVPAEHMHPYPSGAPSWQRDRTNVAKIVRHIDRREPDRPFMLFMFYESSHASYYFPDENIIRRPYTEDLDYARMGPEDAVAVKNRYINACNHLDGQIAAVLGHLEKRKLLESTIVVITGDHGEMFWERKYWGHASVDFSDGELRVPMVLLVPGRKPKVYDRMTSHLDVPATVLALLGVTNPPRDYSLGIDMLGRARRTWTVATDTNRMACLDGQEKIILPYSHGFGQFMQTRVLTRQDEELEGPARSAALRQWFGRLNKAQAEVRKFLK